MKSEREELILKYIPLVKSIAYGIHKKLPSCVDLDDLVGYGIVGLVEAIDRLDTSKGSITYIKLRIKGAIYDYLRSLDFLSRSSRDREKKIKSAFEHLLSVYGREPTDEEVANYLGISLEDLYKELEKLSFSHFLSLDEIFSDGRSYEELFPSKEDQPEEEIIRKDIRDKVINAIRELDDREQLVLQLIFYEDLPLKAVADILGVSVARVSQIKMNALEKLREKLKNLVV